MIQISKRKTFKNKQNGGSGQKQFEVAPIGETGGSSDAQSSIINAKLTQLNAQQVENSQYEGNLEENYELGDKVGGMNTLIKRLSYIPKNLKKLSIKDKLKLIYNLEDQKLYENDYKKEEMKKLFTHDLKNKIKNKTIDNNDKEKINDVLDIVKSSNEVNNDIDEDINIILRSMVNDNFNSKNPKKGGKNVVKSLKKKRKNKKGKTFKKKRLH